MIKSDKVAVNYQKKYRSTSWERNSEDKFDSFSPECKAMELMKPYIFESERRLDSLSKLMTVAKISNSKNNIDEK